MSEGSVGAIIFIIIGNVVLLGSLYRFLMVGGTKYCKNCGQRVRTTRGWSWVGFIFGFGIFYLIYYGWKRPYCPQCRGYDLVDRNKADNKKLTEQSNDKLSGQRFSKTKKWGIILLAFFLPPVGFWFVLISEDFSNRATIISGIWLVIYLASMVTSIIG